MGIINLLLLRFLRPFASPSTSPSTLPSGHRCRALVLGWSFSRLDALWHIAFYLAETFSLQLARTCFYCSHHLFSPVPPVIRCLRQS